MRRQSGRKRLSKAVKVGLFPTAGAGQVLPEMRAGFVGIFGERVRAFRAKGS